MDNLSKSKNLLEQEGYTCVLLRGDEVYTSTERGVKPLVSFIENQKEFQNFSAADKVVGKATAFLYVKLKVKDVFSKVMSKSALKVLKNYGINATFDTLVENIINRTKTDICSFEQAVIDVEDVNLAYEIILNKLKNM